MTHFLRKNNVTIVDADLRSDNDFSVVVVIKPYSRFLLEAEDKEKVIEIFDYVQELRGEYWATNSKLYPIDPNNFLRERLMEVAKEFDLEYVVD